MNNSLFSLTCCVLILFCAVGCVRTSFAPISVPEEFEVMPPAPKNERDVTIRLRELHETDTTPYRIMPGDRFNFSVYEHVELNQLSIVVTPDGYVSVPLAGPVKIGGLSLMEAHDAIRKKVTEYIRNPLISLIPVSTCGYNFTIVGRVNSPGTYPISIGKTTVVEAVAAARGLAQGVFHGDTVEMADLDNAYISRKGEILPVDFRKALLQGDALHNIPLRNDDYIYIPSTMNSNVALLGEVVRPTYVGYKEGMTLLQAVPFAQGLLVTHSSYVRIIRGGMKNPTVYELNIDKILRGEARDFPLQANDIVYIPPGGLSNWNIMISKILPSIQALSMLAGPFGNPSTYFNGK